MQYGALGIMVLGLGWGYLDLRKENKELHERIYALQDARRQDAQDNLDKVAEPLQVSGEAMQMFMGKIAESKGKRK